MSLSAPPSVDTGEIFTLSISAGPPPNVGVAGYATEVILPTGLEWLQQPDCTDEVVATHSGGSPPVVCLSAAGPNGEVRHVAATGLVPPLPALDTPLTSLLEIDLRCSAPGSHKVALTSAPASAFGAVYFGTDAEAIDVTTAPQDVDVDGDTVADYAEVADGLVIECSGPTLTPTATATPTGTATSTATPTPCLPGGCPTPTITPTFVLLPDSDSPSPTPTSEPGSTTSPPPPETPTETATASPTATLISEIGDPLVVAPRTPTQTGVSGVLAVVGTPGATETALSQALQLPDAGGDGSGGSGPPRVAFIAALLGLGGALLAAAGYRRARASRQARL